MRGHDWRNYKTCMCGERGCGSYRPFPTGPTSRELRTIPLAELYPEENQ